MDWESVWEKVKYVFACIGQIILYIIEFLWKWIKKIYKFLKKKIKRYIRLLVRHTKAGDYSILIYTILGVLVLIFMFVFIGKLSHSSKKKPAEDNTPPEIMTSTDSDTDANSVISNTDLKEQAKGVYELDKDFLMLVNKTTPIPDGYTFTHHTLNCGYDVDERIFEDLKNMLSACNTAGHEYNIVSAYRSSENQQMLYDKEIETYKNMGYSEETAISMADEKVAKPGYSEHQTGLSLDLANIGVSVLNEDLLNDGTYLWLAGNCYDYGFILRYPPEKSSVTGIEFEPWHFRYVGQEAATYIMEHGICLEEYVDSL